MSWVMIGLVCSLQTCTWMAPAFDYGSYFHSECECRAALKHMKRGIYKELSCRRDR